MEHFYLSRTQKTDKKPLTIGITGIFGSGKTTVAGIFGREGIPVISCDAIVHRLLKKKNILGKIRKLFGESVFEGGMLDRRKMGKLIFSSSSKRIALEKMLHPHVFKEIEKRKLDYAGKSDIIVIEVPLLFETKSEILFDKTVVVSSSPKEIKERLKGKFSEEEVAERWNNQLPLSEKEKKADYIIRNSNDKSAGRQVHLLIEKLKSEIISG
ncbi:MAG: dephospho-CoA kinase [Candidatus Omnitrophica bacterium]|nr:dephospho-CoA kinase [Candidatus Omnitrophota bacterium]